MNKKIITCDEILGKEAIDPNGSVLGVVTKVHIDRKKKKIVGITIDMGILKPDLYVGADHIKNFGSDAVLLKKVPIHKYKGFKVLTAEGKVLGKVIEMVADDTHIKEFIIKNKEFLEPVKISYKDIKDIGESIILKKNYKEKKAKKS